jgi:hypothetical protein
MNAALGSIDEWTGQRQVPWHAMEVMKEGEAERDSGGHLKWNWKNGMWTPPMSHSPNRNLLKKGGGMAF